MMNNLRGIFGSVGRALMGRQEQEPVAPQTGGYRGMGPGMDGAPLDAAPRRAAPSGGQPRERFPIGTFLLSGYSGVDRRREQQAAEQEAARMEQMRSVAAELFPDNPRAQLLFALDPKAFGGALAEGLKPQTRESGKVYIDPLTGEREGMARIDQFGDRYGFVDPETLESGFGAPRGPTYAEETGRRGQEATAAIGMGNLGVARGNLGLREREFNRGPASGGGAGGAPWTKYSPGGSQ